MRKGALMRLYVDAFAIIQLYEMEIAKQARDIQSEQGKKAVAHKRGGPITVAQARKTMQSREDDEIAKDNRILVRL